MDNIFETLKERGVPFAVLIFVEQMKIKGIDASSKGYYIAILKRDKKVMQGFRFKQSTKYGRTIVEYNLGDDEVEYFRNRADRDYTKVLHNKEGRVYEPKGAQSFKQLHSAIRDEF